MRDIGGLVMAGGLSPLGWQRDGLNEQFGKIAESPLV